MGSKLWWVSADFGVKMGHFGVVLGVFIGSLQRRGMGVGEC